MQRKIVKVLSEERNKTAALQEPRAKTKNVTSVNEDLKILNQLAF